MYNHNEINNIIRHLYNILYITILDYITIINKDFCFC